MDILDSEKSGRTYTTDVRSILGVNSTVLPDSDMRIDEDGPNATLAEEYAKSYITDWADFPEVDLTTGEKRFLYLYFIALYKLACLVWDSINDPGLKSEKSPDYEYVRDTKGMRQRKEEVCAMPMEYMELLGVDTSRIGIEIVDGSSGDVHERTEDG